MKIRRQRLTLFNMHLVVQLFLLSIVSAYGKLSQWPGAAKIILVNLSTSARTSFCTVIIIKPHTLSIFYLLLLLGSGVSYPRAISAFIRGGNPILGLNSSMKRMTIRLSASEIKKSKMTVIKPELPSCQQLGCVIIPTGQCVYVYTNTFILCPKYRSILVRSISSLLYWWFCYSG